MSGYVTGLVLRNSTMTGTARLVMIVIAEACEDDGTDAWPSIPTIADRARVDRRSVQRALKSCTEAGELIVAEQKGGPVDRPECFRTHRYSIPISGWVIAEGIRAGGGGTTPPLTVPEGAASTTGGGGTTPPNPSFDPSLESKPFVADAPIRSSTARKTSTPETFPVTAAMKTWAEANGADNLDLERETAQFLDHHAAKGSTFVDWTRAWQTWIRNQVKWATQRIASSAETAPKIVALRWDPDDL